MDIDTDLTHLWYADCLQTSCYGYHQSTINCDIMQMLHCHFSEHIISMRSRPVAALIKLTSQLHISSIV